MTRPDPHARFDELAAGHALHALEPEDEQVFLAHLSGCARCARELDEHAAVLAQLAYEPDAADPPRELLDGIRAGVLASGREASFPSAPEPVPLDEVRRRRDAARLRRAGLWTGMAAAAALVVSLAVWNTVLRQDRDQLADLSDRMAAAVSELRDESTETVPLRADSGEVVAVALVHGEELSVVVEGLPVNDEATSYVVWGESSDGARRAVGVFDVTSDELDVRQGLELQADVPAGTKLLVTQEQGDEAPAAPTLPVLAVGTV